MLERDVMKSCLKINHANILAPEEARPIPLCVGHLILVLRSLFVNRDDVLDYPKRLARLLSGYQQKGGNALWFLMRLNLRDDALGHQPFQMIV